jgi:hypothetical protein
MKKILLFLGVALLSLSVNATPATLTKKFAKTSVQAAAVKAPRAEFETAKAEKALAPKAKEAQDTIKIVGIRSIAYYATQFIFKCNPAKSTYYNFDICSEDRKYIATGGWRKAALDTINAQYGYYAFQSDWILNYGINGTNISEHTTNESVIASFQEQWQKYAVIVDEEDDEYYYGLKPGKYVFFVEGFGSDQTTTTEEYAGALYEVVWYSASNLNAEVSEDKTKATLSWTMPENLFTGAQLQVAVYDNEGEKAYSNYDSENDTILPITSPITFDVAEGKTYTAMAQIYTADRHQAGEPTEYIFSVGENEYAPKELKAEVLAEEGDSVLLSWTAETKAYAYYVNIYYQSGEYMAQNGYEPGDQVNKMLIPGEYAGVGIVLPPATYSWSVMAVNYDGTYISYASEEVEGQAFTTQDIVAPVITNYEVVTSEGSTSAVFTFEVEDNYYDVDDMTFHVSGDITGAWTTKNGKYTLRNLEVGKEYTIEVSVEDPASNINDFATVTIIFTAGQAQAIDQVIFDIKANKVLRDGQLIIKRDQKAFNVLGAEL